MSSTEKHSDDAHFRQVLSPAPDGWTVTLYGPGLPEHGAQTSVSRLADADLAAAHLEPVPASIDTDDGYSSSTDHAYDFGPETNTAMEDFIQARIALESFRDVRLRGTRAGLCLLLTLRPESMNG